MSDSEEEYDSATSAATSSATNVTFVEDADEALLKLLHAYAVKYVKGRTTKKYLQKIKKYIKDRETAILKETISQRVAADLKDYITQEVQATVKTILEEQLKPIEQTITTKIQDVIQNKLPQSSSTPTFAEVLQRSSEPSTLLISSKNPETSVQTIEKTLNKSLASKDLNIKTNRTRDGKILVKATDDKTIKTLQERLESVSEVVSYEVPKPRLVEILIFNAPEFNKLKSSPEEIDNYKTDILLPGLQRSLGTPLEDVEIVRSFASKDRNHSNIAINIAIQHAINLLRNKRITLGFNSCPLTKYIRPQRCTNCQSFEHTKNICKNDPFCGICSRKHPTADCTVNFMDKEHTECINCAEYNKELVNTRRPKLPINHPAIWGGCPIYKKVVNKLLNEQRQQYGSTTK